MRLQALVVAGSLLVGTAAHADWDHGRLRRTIEEAIHLEEGRMKELETVAVNDDRLANELENGVKAREAGAAKWEAKEREFIEFAGMSEGKDKAEFESLAREMRTFADHDRGLATARRQAMEILRNQARGAREGVENHKAHIDRMRARLDRWR